jgi:hypothetical protein
MSTFCKLFGFLSILIFGFSLLFATISPAVLARDFLPGNTVICKKDNCKVIGNDGSTDVVSDDFKGAQGITKTIIDVAKIITYISGGLSVLFIVYGGVRYLTSGTEKDAGDARTIVQNAIIGLVITVIAYAIISIVTGLLSGQFIG